ncbi:MAG: hypothetical protein H0V39_02195 [Nitrosomonas sp.]|nr:hypothetical protein [Nitrosomonas sp.]
MLLSVYLLVCLILIARYSREVFSESERSNAWNSMLANFANAHLLADPPFTRLRRRIAAMLLILAESLLWPRNAVISLVGRPFLRRNAVGQLIPRRHRPTTLFYVFLLGERRIVLITAIHRAVVLCQWTHSRAARTNLILLASCKFVFASFRDVDLPA